MMEEKPAKLRRGRYGALQLELFWIDGIVCLELYRA
jgi:hypothetical protein